MFNSLSNTEFVSQLKVEILCGLHVDCIMTICDCLLPSKSHSLQITAFSNRQFLKMEKKLL